MTATPDWHFREAGVIAFARNMASRYAVIFINIAIGLLLLPYNLSHLGASAYGLWMLTASVTTYFGVLELGYGGAVIKFVAEYRSRGDARGLNEVLSTMFYVFSGIGAAVYLVAIGVSFLLPHIFALDPEQARIGQIVFLIIAVNVSLHFVFSVFGAVINGFERYDLNNVVGTAANVAAAGVNVLVLWLGYGLVELVAATTAVRIAPYVIYRRNAYKVFPELQIHRALFRRRQLRELTSFSVYFAIINWSGRLTYSADLLILGMFFSTAVLAIYGVAQRLANALLTLTNQLHTVLFPAVVFRAAVPEPEAQRNLMVRATRFQLAMAVGVCGSVAAVADVLIPAWVGQGYEASASVLQVLALLVVARCLKGMPTTILKGTGHHKFLAYATAGGALASLLLSIPAVQTFGMHGVAWAMVVPAGVLALAVVFPRTCRVVGLPVREGYRQVIWPACWPAAAVVTLLWATRHAVPAHLPGVLSHVALGGLLYGALFYGFGLDRLERRWCAAAAGQVWRYGSQLLSTAQGETV